MTLRFHRSGGDPALERADLAKQRIKAFLMTGPWELDADGLHPGIYMDDPEGGDPVLLARIDRLYHPDLLRDALGDRS